MGRGGAVELKECRASVRDKRIRLDFVQRAFVSRSLWACKSKEEVRVKVIRVF